MAQKEKKTNRYYFDIVMSNLAQLATSSFQKS